MLRAVAWLVQSCRITSRFQNNNARKTIKTKRKRKNECTALLESNTALRKFINIIKYSIRNGGRRIRHTIYCRYNYNRSARTQNATEKHESPVIVAQGRSDVVKIYYKTYENHPRCKTQQQRYVMAHHQADQIRKLAAAQRYSDSRRSHVICCRLQYCIPHCKGSLVRHHEFCSKKKVNLSFDITANASKIRFCIDI